MDIRYNVIQPNKNIEFIIIIFCYCISNVWLLYIIQLIFELLYILYLVIVSLLQFLDNLDWSEVFYFCVNLLRIYYIISIFIVWLLFIEYELKFILQSLLYLTTIGFV